MTLTAQLEYPRDRTIIVAVVVSLALHALLFLPGVRDFFKSLELDWDKEPEPVAIPIEFSLVAPPQDPIPTNEVSKYLSTVSSAARDNTQSDQESDTPHGEGISPFPDNPSPTSGADGGGQSEVPPLPEQVDDLGEVFRKSRYIEQSSPQREQSLPDEVPEFYNEGSARASINGIQLNTTAWDFAPYLLDLKHRIKQHWIPPLAFTAMGAIHGYTWIRFRIHPDGSMDSMEIVETEGHESLHRSSANAVKGAAPFRELPADFPEPYLEITFGFYYLLPGDEQRFLNNRERRSP